MCRRRPNLLHYSSTRRPPSSDLQPSRFCLPPTSPPCSTCQPACMLPFASVPSLSMHAATGCLPSPIMCSSAHRPFRFCLLPIDPLHSAHRPSVLHPLRNPPSLSRIEHFPLSLVLHGSTRWASGFCLPHASPPSSAHWLACMLPSLHVSSLSMHVLPSVAHLMWLYLSALVSNCYSLALRAPLTGMPVHYPLPMCCPLVFAGPPTCCPPTISLTVHCPLHAN